MKTLRVFMTERVFYNLVIEVEDDASDEAIAAIAEEQFVQGNYTHGGQDDRQISDWEEVGTA